MDTFLSDLTLDTQTERQSCQVKWLRPHSRSMVKADLPFLAPSLICQTALLQNKQRIKKVATTLWMTFLPFFPYPLSRSDIPLATFCVCLWHTSFFITASINDDEKQPLLQRQPPVEANVTEVEVVIHQAFLAHKPLQWGQTSPEKICLFFPLTFPFCLKKKRKERKLKSQTQAGDRTVSQVLIRAPLCASQFLACISLMIVWAVDIHIPLLWVSPHSGSLALMFKIRINLLTMVSLCLSPDALMTFKCSLRLCL